VVGVIVLVVVLGGVGFLLLSGGDDGVKELETGGASITVGDRIETTTTTEPERTTTTAPTTTTVPTSSTASPFPDFGTPGGVAPGGPPTPGGSSATSCPSGGIDTQVTATSFSQFGTDYTITVEGRSVNNTTAPVTLDLTVSISHTGSQPNPWVQPVTQSRSPVPPGQTSTWTFTGTINGGTATGITGIGGGFRWADPALSSCPTQ
jgi:hypothetical protein